MVTYDIKAELSAPDFLDEDTLMRLEQAVREAIMEAIEDMPGMALPATVVKLRDD